MTFNRKETQLFFERLFGAEDNLQKWQECNFKEFKIEGSYLEDLKILCRNDAANYYFNGLLTLFEALNGLKKGNYSWTIIKLYYSTFYLLRASFYANHIIFIRQKQLYYLELKTGNIPVRKGNKKYNSDHQGTIWHYIDLFESSDILLSNKIEDIESYIWLMTQREEVNYRLNIFQEPIEYSILSYFISKGFDKNFKELIIEQMEDPFIACFQQETAIIAIPVKRLLLTNDDFKLHHPSLTLLNDDQYNFLNKILGDQDLLNKFLN